MRCNTAVLAESLSQREDLNRAKALLSRRVQAARGIQLGLHRDPSNPPATYNERHCFGWSEPDVVGLAGLEPPPSSLSEIDSQAPCYPAFAQVVLLRKSYKDGVNSQSPPGSVAGSIASAVLPGLDGHEHLRTLPSSANGSQCCVRDALRAQGRFRES